MTYATVLSALADGTRRQVFEHLALGPKSVGEIAALLPVSRPAVSQHLGVLKSAQLVFETRLGTTRIYQINPDGLTELHTWLNGLWGDALKGLKTLSENTYEHPKSSKRNR
jgi:DNA-binding transcriptional ArsR family regulator